MSDSWGHWVNEVLTRIAIAHADGLLVNTVVFVLEEVPRSFIELSDLLFPEIHWATVRSGELLRIDRLYVIPYQTLIQRNIRWSMDGIARRCLSVPTGFEFLRRRFQARRSQIQSRAKVEFEDARVVCLRRKLARYRRGRNEERLAELAANWGWLEVEPAELDPASQLMLFSARREFVGAMGSQWFMPLIAPEGSSALALGHDQASDWSGWNWTFSVQSGEVASWAVGFRDFPLPGYSDELYHQDFSPDWTAIGDFVADRSRKRSCSVNLD